MFGNALIFLFAGYDTTSSAMSFTLFCLAANPSCLQKAVREVDEKLGQVRLQVGTNILKTISFPAFKQNRGKAKLRVLRFCQGEKG